MRTFLGHLTPLPLDLLSEVRSIKTREAKGEVGDSFENKSKSTNIKYGPRV